MMTIYMGLILTILATLSAAAPRSPASIFARGNCDSNYHGGIYVCDHPQYTGKCDYYDLASGNEYGLCKTLTNHQITSFGPSAGLNCWAWTDSECGKGTVFEGINHEGHPGQAVKDIACPGYDNLFLLGVDNRLLSFKCEKV
ncbi:D-galacturonate reductase [Venturia nashicola]|uniref:D-galacturonate reductase n=1 Tax=Venturia nashicola TaxID=86259 RepID=A0A4Z1NZ06_9PEZI|nr:D-galacturonate reductase [Venturia nashicola]TLD14836.1 D-galacturonate reductase [Venturia nashicola]